MFFARTCALRSSPPVLPPKMGDGVFGSSVGSVHFGFSGAAAGASFSSARTTTLARLFPGFPLWMRRVALVGAQATVCMATCFVVDSATNDLFSTDQMTIDTLGNANPDPVSFFSFSMGWLDPSPWNQGTIQGTPFPSPTKERRKEVSNGRSVIPWRPRVEGGGRRSDRGGPSPSTAGRGPGGSSVHQSDAR